MNKDIELIEKIEALTNAIRDLQSRITGTNDQRIYTNKMLLELLQINTSTLQKYRDEGLLGYSKIGNKFFYTSDDVNRFLKSNHYKPFAE